MAGIRVFISHSSSDAEVAHAIVDLLRSALNLLAEEIRCTSVEGHRLSGGAQTDEELRQEIATAESFIGLISPASIESAYVLFEMGARWGAARRLIPLLVPGSGPANLRGPLAGMNALHCDSEPQLHQLVTELSKTLGVSSASPAAYLDELKKVTISKPGRVAEVPAAKPPPPPLQLNAEHEEVLKIFAEASDWKLATAEDVAKLARINRTRAHHLLDQLYDDHYVSILPGEMGGLYYSLSKKGRAHAVQQGYC